MECIHISSLRFRKANYGVTGIVTRNGIKVGEYLNS